MTSYKHWEDDISIYILENCDKIPDILSSMTRNTINRYWTAFDVKYVYHLNHIKFALLKSIILQSQNKLKTKQSWHSEVLYQLAPTTNISEALRLYGLKETTKYIGFAIFTGITHEIDSNNNNNNNNNNSSSNIKESEVVDAMSIISSLKMEFGGNEIVFDEINDREENNERTDEIIQLFKILPPELDICSIESAIITRIATKDVL